MADEPLIFGKHTLQDADRRVAKSVNPAVNEFGPGPFSLLCRTCTYLTPASAGHRCDVRPPGFKHSPFWPACAKYEDREQDKRLL